jgi:PPP family 3-phenylpropionic acid transporter
VRIPALGAGPRLTLLYASLFFELGVNLPFFPVWLRSRALDATEIGLVLALPFALRIVANPVVAALADLTGRIRPAIVACACVAAAGFLLLPFAHGIVQIAAVVGLVALAQGPLIALTDAATLRVLAGSPAAESRYGRIRLAGSVAFAAASFAGGALLADRSPGVVVSLLGAAAVAVAFCTLLLPETPAGRSRAPEPGAATAGAGLAVLALAVAGPALVQASHAAVYAFGTLHWQSLGYSGPTLGLLWSLGIAGEVLFFLVAGSFAAGEVGAIRLLSAGAAAAALRWAAMALDPPLVLLAPLQLLHGLSFGATHLGSVFLLAAIAPAAAKAQAQAWLAAVWAIAMAALTSLAGLMSDGWGQGIYWPMVAVALLGLVLVRGVAVARNAAVEASAASS